MIDFIVNMMFVVACAIRLIFVIAVWACMLFAVHSTIQNLVQSRRDTNLFKQIEEFRRDFS